MSRKRRPSDRRGAVLVLITILLVPLLVVVALTVDYGYLLKVQSDLQRTADAAALAGVQELVPAPDGTQDLGAVRDAVKAYAASNSGQSFQVLDADIEIGRYDPTTIYTNVTLLNTGLFDTVRVRVRRDSNANSRVGLFITPIVGIPDAGLTATATAVLQRAVALAPGADVLPFAVPLAVWDGRAMGEQWSIYGNGNMKDSFGGDIPGNWGTLDIGATSNSTAALNNQIKNGLSQADLNALYADGRIPSSTHIDASQPLSMQGDTGLSSGLKQSVIPAHGSTRLVPIFDYNSGAPGNNLEYHVVKWGVVTLVTSTWQGENNTNVTIKKSYDYMGELRPKGDLSDQFGTVEGAFTSPVLVE